MHRQPYQLPIPSLSLYASLYGRMAWHRRHGAGCQCVSPPLYVGMPVYLSVAVWRVAPSALRSLSCPILPMCHSLSALWRSAGRTIMACDWARECVSLPMGWYGNVEYLSLSVRPACVYQVSQDGAKKNSDSALNRVARWRHTGYV